MLEFCDDCVFMLPQDLFDFRLPPEPFERLLEPDLTGCPEEFPRGDLLLRYPGKANMLLLEESLDFVFARFLILSILLRLACNNHS